ncbi:MAG: DUF4336 domain-containing protein [Timaviella obliquedivisa GSE-PSE-MK23-08B]|jgi:hypothetical protein|nr:DUF4336 domain-containing protein [Timaviella obliquedivisa GSE-PSE-MK23-08B]
MTELSDRVNNHRDWSWRFWFTVPLYPYSQRRTLCTEVVKDRIWTFDQLQGILYVAVPIRMTAVRLDEGGLLIYAPVAPTPECIRLLQELVVQHGGVKYIILPTVSGLEHKVFVGPFARKFPQAQVYVAPNQWSFPISLPLSWLGFPIGRTHVLPEQSHEAPFGTQFDYAILTIDLGLGTFGEVAFFDRRSQTLLVTDTVLVVPEVPPAIVRLNPDALMFHAKDQAFDRVEANEATFRKGWQRISLFAFYFRPSVLEPIALSQAFKDASKAYDRSRKAYFGIFPFRWREDWQRSFEALRGKGRLLVAPILQTLILNRSPKETLEWADRVSQWNFQRIIPCHFDSPIMASPQEFRQAFTFLERRSNPTHPLLPEDFELLQEIDRGLTRWRISPSPKEKV